MVFMIQAERLVSEGMLSIQPTCLPPTDAP